MVRLLGYGWSQSQEHGRCWCLVMEYIAGENLVEYCQRRGKDNEQLALAMIMKIARALEPLHKQKVIHRDLKPNNIVVDKSGEPYILDFGIARMLEAEATRLSQATLVGTPGYQAPEQLREKELTPRCDIWPLGVMLYELVEGRRPFSGSVLEIQMATIQGEVSWGKLESNPKLQQIVAAALSKNAEDRPAVEDLCCRISNYFRSKVGPGYRWDSVALATYRRQHQLIKSCAGLAQPLLAPRVLVVGEEESPAEVWLGYAVGAGRQLSKVRIKATAALVVTKAIVNAGRQVKPLGLEPGLPPLGDIYMTKDGRLLGLVAGEWLRLRHGNLTALKLHERLLPVVAKGEQDEWKKQEPKSEESVEKWLERLDKEEAGLRRLGELEAELAAMSGEEAEQLCRELLGYYWGLDRLRRPAEKLVRKLREGEGEMAVRLHFGEPEGEVLASWEQSNRAGERRWVWLTQRVVVGKGGGGRKVQAGSMPSGWSEELWKECWDKDWRLIDFTTKAWQECKHREHLELSRAYQQWYAERLGFAEPQKKEQGKEFKGGESELELMLVPPGRFMMGSPQGEKGHYDDEQQHVVTISQGYWLGRTALSQEQWQAIAGSRPWDGEDYAGKEASAAANYMGYAEVDNELLPELQRVLGGEYRIPSEAEWEHACRAGTLTRFYWGEDESEQEIGKYAWYDGNYQGDHPQPVGVKLANAWGLCDMSGNVYEGCRDLYQGNYGLAKLKQDKKAGFVDPVSTTGSFRVYRGGLWDFDPVYCRCAGRGGWWLGVGDDGVGVRMQQVIPPC